MTQNRATTVESGNDLLDLARLWACRLLLNGRGYRGLDERNCRMNDDMCLFVGLDPQRAGTDRPYVRRHLQQSLKQVSTRVTSWPSPLGERLAELGHHLSLTSTEQELLGLVTMLSACEALRDIAKTTAQAAHCDHLALAAIALDRDPADLAPILSSQSRLARAGLLRMHTQRGFPHRSISEDLDVPSWTLLDGLATALTVSTESIDGLLGRYLQPVEPAQPGNALEFDFCAEVAGHVGALVDHALASGEPGVNVLIHGIPGVGKTELVRMQAGRRGWDLYSVSACDTVEHSLTGMQRFHAYQLCQFLLAGREDSVLMFDEIEDVFDPRFTCQPDRFGGGTAGKAWTNRLLETNVRPVIWISNSTDALDPAYLRRFDYILRLDTPPRESRRRMLTTALNGLAIPSEWIDARAGEADMTPARIAQIGRLAQRLSEVIDRRELPTVLDQQLAQQRTVQPTRRSNPQRRGNPLDVYALDYVNTSPSVASLLRGLARNGAGSVLMHGPPGTGKTAFAEHVAEQLERELVSRSASGLLDKYVGETERALAEMFDTAARDNAVLLLDEADNFLTDRSGAQHRWELTETNELLVQMERFGGIFLCATNLVEALDPAVMRRFDVKLEFDYLDASQAWALFEHLLDRNELERPDAAGAQALHRRMAALDRLTPGDFVAVARGNTLLEESAGSAEEFIERLEAEHRMKPGARRARPGFV